MAYQKNIIFIVFKFYDYNLQIGNIFYIIRIIILKGVNTIIYIYNNCTKINKIQAELQKILDEQYFSLNRVDLLDEKN